jgi:6-phosphofructokinase 1
MGYEAVKSIMDNEFGVMIGLSGRNMVRVPIDKVLSEKRTIDVEVIKLAKILS